MLNGDTKMLPLELLDICWYRCIANLVLAAAKFLAWAELCRLSADITNGESNDTKTRFQICTEKIMQMIIIITSLKHFYSFLVKV